MHSRTQTRQEDEQGGAEETHLPSEKADKWGDEPPPGEKCSREETKKFLLSFLRSTILSPTHHGFQYEWPLFKNEG